MEMKLAAARRTRLMLTGGIIAVAIIALVVAIVVSSNGAHKSNTKVNASTKAAAQKVVAGELAGIPQSGNVLGKASAPITLIEYGDLVCPICRDFAVTTEPGIIKALVKTGKAKLEFRGFETASQTANNSEYPATQVAARSAGLQGREWNYILLMYREQPQTLNGQPAEEVSYITPKYLQDLAAQVPGLNLIKWQANLGSQSLANDVTVDGQAALASGAQGTPAVTVTGPKGTALDQESIPTLAGLESTISQLS